VLQYKKLKGGASDGYHGDYGINRREVVYSMKLITYAARILLSWSRVVSETCPTRVLCILRICHVSTCVHFNVAVSV